MDSRPARLGLVAAFELVLAIAAVPIWRQAHDMTDATGLTTANDRLVVTLDPGGPIEITGLSASLAALARIYDRHHRQDLGDVAPKLYIARLRTGSIIAEIVPLLFLSGQVVPYAEGAMVIADFTRRVGMGLRAFARRQSPPPQTSPKRTGGT